MTRYDEIMEKVKKDSRVKWGGEEGVCESGDADEMLEEVMPNLPVVKLTPQDLKALVLNGSLVLENGVELVLVRKAVEEVFVREVRKIGSSGGVYVPKVHRGKNAVVIVVDE